MGKSKDLDMSEVTEDKQVHLQKLAIFKNRVERKKAFVHAIDDAIKEGKKYIKIVEKGGGVKAFVVGVDNDKKFKKGDILMAAGWNAPARNAARGNILDGGYAINWTGACYLK